MLGVVVDDLALLGIGWFARNTVENVKINSEAYRRIVVEKDLLSDLTPAVLNVVRAKAIVTGADPGAKPEVIAEMLEELGREKAAFQKAYSKWNDSLPEGVERTHLVDRVGGIRGRSFSQLRIENSFRCFEAASRRRPKSTPSSKANCPRSTKTGLTRSRR